MINIDDKKVLLLLADTEKKGCTCGQSVNLEAIQQVTSRLRADSCRPPIQVSYALRVPNDGLRK
jgi:hypothetical protein